MLVTNAQNEEDGTARQQRYVQLSVSPTVVIS